MSNGGYNVDIDVPFGTSIIMIYFEIIYINLNFHLGQHILNDQL